jgi:hypothetical protein
MQCQPRGRVYNVISPTTVWNKEAQQRLTNTSPNWLQTLQRSIPEAVWNKTGTGYYNYWKDLRLLVNKPATNAFWNNITLSTMISVVL